MRLTDTQADDLATARELLERAGYDASSISVAVAFILAELDTERRTLTGVRSALAAVLQQINDMQLRRK